MKKIILLNFALLILMLFVSCIPDSTDSHSFEAGWSSDENYHWKICTDDDCKLTAARATHSFDQITENPDGTKTYFCKVCGAKRSEHNHIYSDDYTSNSTHHWLTCTVEGCTEVYERDEHSFDDGMVVLPPTSETEGKLQYQCDICGKTKSESIEKLPKKMSREAWVKSFVYENVKIVNTAAIGGIGSSGGTLLIDGSNAVQILDTGEEVYVNATEALTTIRFGDYYDLFSHNGNGVYYAANLKYRFALESDTTYLEYLDCTITFDGETLTKISYRVDTGIFGVITDTYIFTDWGEIALETPSLSKEELSAALKAENFEGNISVYKDEIVNDGTRSTEMNVVNDIYTIVITDENNRVIYSDYESSDGFAEELSNELREIIDLVDTDSLVYDTYEGFIFEGEIMLTDGSGDVLVYLVLYLEDDKICNVTYITEDQSGNTTRQIHYYIYYEDET